MNDYIGELFSLNGKVAIVTGASRGIGESIAQGLSNAEALVVGVARSAEPGQKLSERNYRQCDILDTSAFEKLCHEVHGELGRIDILVNVAGLSLPPVESGSRKKIFNQTLETNLVSTYNCCDIVSEFMGKAGGSIINITSIGSYLGFPENPGYIASKGGVRALTKSLALDYAQKNIRVNNIVPGYIRTAMTEKSYSDEKLNRERIDRMMIQRWGKTEDLIGAAIYLASEASSYVTGADVVVDGGWTAKGI